MVVTMVDCIVIAAIRGITTPLFSAKLPRRRRLCVGIGNIHIFIALIARRINVFSLLAHHRSFFFPPLP